MQGRPTPFSHPPHQSVAGYQSPQERLGRNVKFPRYLDEIRIADFSFLQPLRKSTQHAFRRKQQTRSKRVRKPLKPVFQFFLSTESLRGHNIPRQQMKELMGKIVVAPPWRLRGIHQDRLSKVTHRRCRGARQLLSIEDFDSKILLEDLRQRRRGHPSEVHRLTNFHCEFSCLTVSKLFAGYLGGS